MENNQENKKEKLVLLDMKMTFKTIVIKTLRYQCGEKKTDQWKWAHEYREVGYLIEMVFQLRVCEAGRRAYS